MGGSKKVTVGYRYFLGMHLALCHGVVDRISRIRVGGKVAWIGDCTDGRININAPELFGGDEREGGVSGALDFIPGRPTEEPNDYLQAQLGTNIPAFRGICCAILRQIYTGMNPYLKPWGFRLQRIHKTTDGAVQWYDDKAAIGTESGVLHESLNLSAVIYAGTDPSVGYTLSGFSPKDFVLLELPANPTYTAWSPWPDDGQLPSPWTCTFRVTDAANVTTSYLPTWYSTAAMAYEEAQKKFPIVLTGSTSYTIWMADTNPPDNRGGLSFRVIRLAGQIDMNPAHIIRECLTDPDWGMGYSTADIDDTAFIAAADKLYAEGMGISLLWDRSGPIEDFIGEIVRHIDAVLYIDRTTGKFILKLIRDDYDKNTLLVLDESNIESISDFSHPALGELVNSVTVNYWDAITGKDASITIQDIALKQIQGTTIGTTIHYPGFTNSVIASRAAQRDLAALSTPIISCTIIANRIASSLDIGDVFKLTWPDYGIAEMIMRVTSAAYGDGRNNRVRLTCTQDVFALPDLVMIPPVAPAWEDPATVTPIPATNRLAFEQPYLELVHQFGQSALDSVLADNPTMGYVGVAVTRAQAGALNARIMTDAGTGYTDVGVVDFCPHAIIAVNITRIDTTWNISGVTDIDAIEPGTWAQIGSEIVAVESITADSITVKRGALDTLPVEHTAGEIIYFWDVFAAGDPTEYASGESVSVKLLPTTGSATLALDEAPEDVVDLVGRAARPYPPGNFGINSQYFPATIPSTSELALTWAHRDRTQQTGGTIIGFADGNIGPEPGTTYTVRLYGETDTLIRTVSGLTGTAYTYPLTTELTDSNLIVVGGDPYFDKVVLGLHMDGVDESTMFTDIKGHTVTANGNAQISTVQSKFGGASGYFDGTGDYLTVPASTEFEFVSGNFTLECWVRFDDVTLNQCLMCSTYLQVAPFRGWVFRYDPTQTTAGVRFVAFKGDPSNLSDVFQFGWSPVNNTWYHIALVRSGNTIYVFIDGAQIGSGQLVNATTFSASGRQLFIGAQDTASAPSTFVKGYLDDVRISLIDRYTTNFTPPAAPFPNYHGLRPNGQLRVELESVRDGLVSYQKYNHTVDRVGYGFNYGEYYGGI